MSECFLYPFSWLLLQFFRNPTWLHRTILPHCLQPGKLSPAIAVLGTSGAHTSCRSRSPSSVPVLPPRQRAICTDTTSLPNCIELLSLLGKIVSGVLKKKKEIMSSKSETAFACSSSCFQVSRRGIESNDYRLFRGSEKIGSCCGVGDVEWGLGRLRS